MMSCHRFAYRIAASPRTRQRSTTSQSKTTRRAPAYHASSSGFSLSRGKGLVVNSPDEVPNGAHGRTKRPLIDWLVRLLVLRKIASDRASLKIANSSPSALDVELDTINGWAKFTSASAAT